MNDQRIVLVLLLCLIAGSNSQGCSDPSWNLQNMVVYEGNSTSFTNHDDPPGVTYDIVPSYPPSTYNTVASGGATPYPASYALDPTHLDIISATIYDYGQPPNTNAISGLYILTYNSDNGCQTMANLIVVYEGPLCQCHPDTATLTCELRYGGAHVQPNLPKMTWTTDPGCTAFDDTPTPNKTNPYYNVSRSTYPVTSCGAASYTCTVTFNAPDGGLLPDLAPNAPSFSASCTIANCVITTTTTSIKSTTAYPTTRVCGNLSACESKWLSDREDFCQKFCGSEC